MSNSNINLLIDPCLNISYSYYIVSTINGDSKLESLGFSDFLMMLIGGKVPSAKDSKNKDDWKIREELSDLIGADCQYDNIPSGYPISETGFDISNQFIVSRKSYDVI